MRRLRGIHTRRSVLAGGAAGLGGLSLMRPAGADAQLPIDDRYVLRERSPVNVKDKGAKGNGSDPDGPAIQSAINEAAAIGGSVVFPATASSYVVNQTLTIPAQANGSDNARGLTLKGYGGFVPIKYTGTGTLFSLQGTSSASVPYVTFEDLRLLGPSADGTGSPSETDASKGIAANYANVATLNRVFVKGFGTGVELGTDCTGWKLHQVQVSRCVKGVAIAGSGSGGFDWYGGQAYLNLLGVSIDGSLNGVSISGVEFDTFQAANTGAAVVKGGAAKVSFNDCRFFAFGPPSQGATVLLDGASADVLFSNCHFVGNAGQGPSPAAIKFANTSYVKVVGGRTTGHQTGSIPTSYEVTDAAARVFLLDTNNAEPGLSNGVLFGGSGAAGPVVLATESGTLVTQNDLVAQGAVIADGNRVVVRKGQALQLNKTDDSAHVTLQYSSGEIYTGNPIRLDNYMKMAAVSAGLVPVGSLFRDSADGKLKFKDGNGVINALY